MPVARRVVLWVLVAGAGSALLASPARAGGVACDTGVLTAAVYNVTPYTWTLVGEVVHVNGGEAVRGRRLLRPRSRPAAAVSSE